MARLHIRAEARNDLLDIWAYTERQWGLAQADRYAASIEEKLSILKTHPYFGRLRVGMDEMFRVLRVGQHQIFYVVQDDTVSIVRILHSAMDPDRHLSD